MSRQNIPQQRTINGDMFIGSPVSVRRSHLMKSTATSPQVFPKVTRSAYSELPKSLKAHILSFTESQIKTMKRELGPDWASEYAGGIPAQPSVASGSQDKLQPARSPKKHKRTNNWLKDKLPTPKGLRDEDRHGGLSSHGIYLDTPPKYNGKAKMIH